MSEINFLTGIADEAASGLAEQIAYHRALGWNHMELRSVNGIGVARLSPIACTNLCAELAESGFSIPVIDSEIGNWGRSIAMPFESDVAELNTLLDLAERTGTRMIRVMSYPNAMGEPWSDAAWATEVIRRLRILTQIAGTSDVTLVHENCAGWGGASIANTRHLVEAVDDVHFRLLFDIGNGLSYGYCPMRFLEQLMPWIAHVHLKDGLMVEGKVAYTMPGDGSASVLNCLRFLIQNGYSGAYAIEPHLHLIPHLQIASGDSALRQSSYQAYAGRAAELLQQAGAAEREVAHVA